MQKRSDNMNWTLFAVASLIGFIVLHFYFGFYIKGPIRIHHSVIGWCYVGLGALVLNWPTALVGLFLVGHHFLTEGTIL